MISILKSTTELDRVHDLFSAARECYALAIRSISQYAPEIDSESLPEFRAHLAKLEEQWQQAAAPAQLREVQSSVRGELRDFRDRTKARLGRLQRELAEATAAMTLFAEGVELSCADCDRNLKLELKQLEDAGASDNIETIRAGIRKTTATISASLDQMRRAHELAMAQMKDEIRALHLEFREERRVLFTDGSTGAWNRQKLDLKLNDLLRQNDRFSLAIISVRNLTQIRVAHPDSVVETVFRSLLGRAQSVLGEAAWLGRWSETTFVVGMDVDPATTRGLASALELKLNGAYSEQEDGRARAVLLDVASVILDRTPGADPAAFIRLLDRTVRSLSRVSK